MKDLSVFLKKYSDKKLILVFPHPDDEAYVSGGLLQLAQQLSIKTKLICLTKGGRGLIPEDIESVKKIKSIREEELKKSCSILGIDDYILWNYPDANLLKTKKEWSVKLKSEIKKDKSATLVTFDLSGITGHPDHLVLSEFIIDFVNKSRDKYKLLLRVPDNQERLFFKDNEVLILAQKPSHVLNYSFSTSFNKIKAIFAHKSQLKDIFFRLHILEWFLFDHKEFYHLSTAEKRYSKKVIFNHI
jgi:LmbE family N-acetylglucosaminyl deacetylase